MSCRADYVKIDNDVVISVKSYLFSGIILLLDKTIICDKNGNRNSRVKLFLHNGSCYVKEMYEIFHAIGLSCMNSFYQLTIFILQHEFQK